MVVLQWLLAPFQMQDLLHYSLCPSNCMFVHNSFNNHAQVDVTGFFNQKAYRFLCGNNHLFEENSSHPVHRN